MALKPGRECNTLIRDIAMTRTFCWLDWLVSQSSIGRTPSVSALGCFVIVATFVSGCGENSKTDNQSKNKVPLQNNCVNNYKACPDNEALINNYPHTQAKVSCESAVEGHVKYGTPNWSWGSFGKFYQGDDYVKTGIIRIADDGVQIQNMYGAMVNSKVECEYDLESEKVLTIMINGTSATLSARSVTHQREGAVVKIDGTEIQQLEKARLNPAIVSAVNTEIRRLLDEMKPNMKEPSNSLIMANKAQFDEDMAKYATLNLAAYWFKYPTCLGVVNWAPNSDGPRDAQGQPTDACSGAGFSNTPMNKEEFSYYETRMRAYAAKVPVYISEIEVSLSTSQSALKPSVITTEQTRVPLPSVSSASGRTESAKTTSEQSASLERNALNLSQGASFDCKKAKSTSEILICNDPELSNLDNELAQIYRQAKSTTADATAFKQQTKAAWKLREDNCRDKECLINWYSERKAALLKKQP